MITSSLTLWAMTARAHLGVPDAVVAGSVGFAPHAARGGYENLPELDHVYLVGVDPRIPTIAGQRWIVCEVACVLDESGWKHVAPLCGFVEQRGLGIARVAHGAVKAGQAHSELNAHNDCGRA